MLEYSTKAKFASAIFYKNENDIDIFVEDNAGVNMHTNLYQRALKDRWKIGRVFSLGSSKDVVSMSQNTKSNSGRVSVFIIDGDLHLSDPDYLTPDNIFQLQKYSIENFLICQNAIAEVAHSFSNTKTISDIKKEIDWDSINSEINQLMPLYVLYAIYFSMGCRHKLVNYSIEKYKSSPKEPSLCKKTIRTRTKEVLKQALNAHSIKDYRSKKNAIKHHLDETKPTATDLTSGKQVILPLYFNFLKRQYGISISKQNFANMLSKNCKIDPSLQKSLIKHIEKKFSS